MSDMNRLIVSAGNQPNFAKSYIAGNAAGQNATSRDLQNTAAQNQLDKQANVNRLLQSGATPEQVAQISPATATQMQAVQKNKQTADNAAKDRLLKSLAFSGFKNTQTSNPELNLDPSFSVFDDNSPQQLELQKLFNASGATQDTVQSSKQLAGGLTEIVYKSGRTEVVPASEADKILIHDAEQRGVSLQGERAQSRGVGKGSAKIALESFDRLGNVRANIANLNEGIRLVREEGAETGALAAKLPSFKSASIKLDALRNRLGLDVIGDVTFGALSKGELDLALDTALPTNLDGEPLIQWMEQKIAAQEILSAKLEDAALFLAKPGNDIADWIQLNRNNKESAPVKAETAQPKVVQLPTTNNQGWKLMTDAQGNKAYVSPNGEIEEVQ